MQKAKKIELYLKKNPRATTRDLERKFRLSRNEAEAYATDSEGVETARFAWFHRWYASELRVLMTLLGLALLVRVIYGGLVLSQPSLMIPLHDAEYYLEWARQIVGGGWLGDRVFFTEPLYAYLLAVFLKVGLSETGLLIFQWLIGATLPLGLYLVTKKVFNREAALITGLLTAFYGPFLFYEGLLLKTSFEVALLPWWLLLMLRAFEYRRAKDFIFLGLLLGLLALIKGNNLIFLPVVLLLLLVMRELALRKRLVLSGLCTFGALIIILPVTLRNYVVAHDLVLTNYSFGLALYQGNWWGGDGSTALVPPFLRPDPRYEEMDAVGMAEAYTEKKLVPSEVSAFWASKAFEEVSAAPGHFLGALWNKVLIFFNHSEFSDNYQYTYYRSEVWLLWLLPNFALVTLLGLLGVILTSSRSFWEQMRPECARPARFLLLFFLASLCVLLLTTVNARYRLPLVPFFLVAAGGGLAFLWMSLREGRIPMLRMVSALGIACLLSWYPLPLLRFDTTAQSSHALGYAALQSRDYSQAETYFKQALTTDPNYAWAYGNLVLTALAEDRSEEAKVHLQKLLVLRSDDLSNYRLLRFYREVSSLTRSEKQARVAEFVARVEEPDYDPDFYEATRALEAGDDVRAEVFYRRSLSRYPDAPATRMALAALLKKATKTEEAKRLLSESLMNHPELFPVRYNLANLYIMEENYGKAAELLRDIYDFVPELGETWYNYAVALIKLGRTSEAVPVMQAYIERYQDDATRKTIVEKFRSALKPAPNTLDSLLPGKR